LFVQRFPMRLMMALALGSFLLFLHSENKVGLMVMLFIITPVIIPISLFIGIYVTNKVDPYNVNLRREYMRLKEVSQAGSWRRALDDQ
jgi:hypothetical protein